MLNLRFEICFEESPPREQELGKGLKGKCPTPKDEPGKKPGREHDPGVCEEVTRP